MYNTVCEEQVFVGNFFDFCDCTRMMAYHGRSTIGSYTDVISSDCFVLAEIFVQESKYL